MEKDFIFGLRAVIEAIEADKYLDKIVLKKGLTGDLAGELSNIARKHHIPVQLVPIEKLNRITRKNHQGCIAFTSPIPFYDIQEIVPRVFESGQTPLILVLDGVTDVRNFGAICRSAEGAGVHAIVIPNKNSVRISSDAVKTSAGALYHIPVCKTTSLHHTITFLQQSGIKIVGATEKSDKEYFKTDMNVPVAIVMGAEDTGISADVLKLVDEKLCIPLTGKIASLNVSVASALFLFECIRQRSL